MIRSVDNRTIYNDVLRGKYIMFNDLGQRYTPPLKPGKNLGFDAVAKSVQRFASKRQVIVADNVAEYCMFHDPTNGWYWNKIPSCTPPFESLAIIAKYPSKQNVEGVISDCKISEIAVFIDTIDVNSEKSKVIPKIHGVQIKQDTRWFCSMLLSMKMRTLPIPGRTMFIPVQWVVQLDAAGRVVGNNCVATSEIFSEFSSPFQIALFALGFLNCKNCKTVDVSREFNLDCGETYRGFKVPFVKFSKVVIEPIEQIRERNSYIPPQYSGEMRFHICRGHFAEYKESGRGLFGRGIYGIFWVPQHFKGRPVNGVVEKQYELSP